jgi:hypothetical protein
LTLNLPKPFFAGAAGGGWRREVFSYRPARTLINQDGPDLPLPRWGVLSGKSPCTRRRWRLYLVQLQSYGAGNESGIPLIILFGGEIAAIESIRQDGRFSARLDGNRLIEFSAIEHRHFDHGYAVTGHSSQGLTAERVLVNADTGVHPDLLNSCFGYVAISRASHEATLFTDDMTKLSPQLSADASKRSALEVSQTPSVAQGIGII